MNKIKDGTRRSKYIAILPSLVTLMNAACGFLAIVYASRGRETELFVFHKYGISSFALSSYMIFFAMIADLLDGRVARLTKTTSAFGGELDSLSDAISFGVAPAFLMLKITGENFEKLGFHFQPAFLEMTVRRGILIIALLYVVCAVIRLARFNVENEEEESAHMNFAGLPSPAAAGVIMSLVIFQKDLLPRITSRSISLFNYILPVITFVIPVAAFFSALLMVSRITYPHVANRLLRGEKSFPMFIGIAFALLFAIWNIQIALVLGFCGFELGGVVYWVIKKIQGAMKKPNAD